MNQRVLQSILLVTIGMLLPARVDAADAAKVEFFETHIRPVLAEHCFECHGSETQWAGLRLDSQARMLKGGDSGPAVVPGKPRESRIVQVIHYSEDDSQMPPEGKLPDETITHFEKWIADGAVWPEGSDNAPADADYFQLAEKHWAFQPITKEDAPEVTGEARIANRIDQFIVSRVHEAGLKQSPRATPRQQLRRLAFDLTGLPPTYEEVRQFAENPSDAAWNQAIDRYLNSQEYGQKWARHWLDLARYADTKGYVFQEERRYPFAYTYRDYVISALNQDIPYDQFIVEQLAADLMPERRGDEALAGLGFLTVGNRYLNRSHEIIDDRIDVTMRGLMGMTVACARCHDHKFDPIKAADYYALYGVFASSQEPERLPQIGEPDDKQAYQKYQDKLAELRKAVRDFEVETAEKVRSEIQQHVEDYLLAIAGDLKHETGRYETEGKYDLRRRIDREMLVYLRQRDGNDPVFGAWRRVLGLEPKDFSAESKKRLDNVIQQIEAGEYQPFEPVKQRLLTQKPSTFYDYVKLYSEVLSTALQAEEQLPEENRDAWKKVRKHLLDTGFPSQVDADSIAGYFHRDERNNHRNLEKKVDQLMVNSPGSPPRAMVLNDNPNPYEPVIFERGNPGRRGDKVPRRFLEVLDMVRKEPFSKDSSGRLELARSIASKDNPLTARIYVNRVWMHLIGEPLVAETSDFGLRTAPPTHPELLDDLASRFMENNWSTKWLIREIVSSETYRQSSLTTPEGNKQDLENRLVWRMNRKRLPFESMRDAMVSAAGVLDKSLRGRPEQLEGPDATFRRAVYGYIDRNNVSQLLRSFDVAGPNVSISQRSETVVPQQPLYLMNSPFIQDLCKRLTEEVRNSVGEQPDHKAFVTQLYQRVLQRSPDEDELMWCLNYINATEEKQNGQKQLAQALLLTNEFFFVD